MSLAKDALHWPVTHQIVSLASRAYRGLLFGGLRMEHDPDLVRFARSGTPAIYAVWHQDFVLTLGYLSRFSRTLGRTYALASASRDGGIAATAAMAMGYRRPVRGSSARGGNRALLELTRLLRDDDGASLLVVVDGPRPPARELKPGIVHLASRTGRPVYLLRSSIAPLRIAERSWARFHVPLPFGRAVCMGDGPIHLPRDLDRAGIERERQRLERRLNDLADRADARVARRATATA
jgi:lysophospholipid acyltransferase (LPLAT)-like uncharacterized protein